MSFKVKLYTMEKYDRSTKQPTGAGKEYECLANAPFSILSPTLRLATGDAVNVYNYVYIPSVDRFYFISEWTYTRGLWEAECAVDVLASWKSYIGDSTLYILRSAEKSNGAIIDMAYPTTAELSVVQKTFTLADSDQLPWKYDGSSGGYIVGIIGYGGAVGYWYMAGAVYGNFMNQLFDPAVYDLQAEQEKRDFNPIQYIASVMYVPFTLSPTGTISVKVGWWTLQNVSAWFLGSVDFVTMSSGAVTVPKHPQAERGKYMNTGNFSSYALQLPCFGVVEIPPALVQDSATISVDIQIELATGSAILMVKASGRTQPIIIQETQVGCPVQISQITGGFLSNAARAITTAVGSDSVAGQVVRATRSAISAVGELVPFVNVGESTVSTKGSNGSRGMTTIPAALLATFSMVTAEDIQHRGRPLCELVKVSTLSGYMQAADGDILAPATNNELRAIKAYLEGGFFYE